jgi:ABC-type Mn2+/Zn2+ transport system ATPase subunit
MECERILTDGGRPATAGPVIRIRDLTLGYGAETVLRGVSVDIPAGLFLPFVGPNGAGKTTLLRAILGLIRPQAGRIETPFGESPPGYVAQQKAIDPIYPVSVREIVRMGCHPLRKSLSTAEILERVDRQLDRFDLGSHGAKTFAQLSGGMRQKVMIARAFVSEPRVLIMDEPTTELDEASQKVMLTALHRAVVEEGRTVLLAHHGLDAIAERAETVCLVRDGNARMVPLSEAHF